MKFHPSMIKDVGKYAWNHSARIGHAFRIPLFLTACVFLEQELFARFIGLSGHPYLMSLVGSTFGLGMLLFGPAIFLDRRTRLPYLFVISLPVSLILISQYLYYTYANAFLQASALSYARQAADEQATIMTLLSSRLIVFLLPLILIPCVAYFIRREVLKETYLSKKEKLVGLFLWLIMVTGGYGVFFVEGVFSLKNVTNPYVTLRDMNNFIFAPNDAVRKVGIVNYYFRDLIGYAFRHKQLATDDISFTKAWLNKQPKKEEGGRFGSLKGRNLILLQVESLEQAVIGQTIAGVEITPHLNALMKKGYSFSNYYTQVGPGNTADAEFVTLNSLYPLSNTVAFIDYARNTFTALPKLLGEIGYQTYVLHDDVPTFWNRSNIYPGLGYQVTLSKDDFVLQGEPVFGHVGDEEFLLQSLTKIQRIPTPFMATIITLSSHTPFIIPPSLQTLPISPDADLTETQRNYLESVHYTDQAIGKFMQGLEVAGLATTSLIAIYGDHGSFSKITEKIGTSTNSRIDDLRTNQVPLLLLAPGAIKGKSFDIPASHLDLYPTLANLLGVHTSENIFGQDLLNTNTPVVTHRDADSQIIRTILTPTLAYIAESDGIFDHGTCVLMPSMTEVLIEQCAELYRAQLDATKASDFIIRGNLLSGEISGN